MIPSWKPKYSFEDRHLGPSTKEIKEMLHVVNAASLSHLIKETIPGNILNEGFLSLGEGISEQKYLKHIKSKASKNKVFRSYIGQGYYGTFTPSVILRNIFENPGWYTQYTPYQAEISQGRLEALLNFQTMVSELTGMPIANASLLDEGTAAAEAMIMFYNQVQKSKKTNHKNKFLVSDKCFPQTKDVIITRAEPLDIQIEFVEVLEAEISDDVFGLLLQYPDAEGAVYDYEKLCSTAHDKGAFVAVAADILSLTLLKEPASWGADVVVGNTQRFGVPMGFGGPHAAYFATIDKFTRQIPGRIIGVSQDRYEKPALRMALQTREQHIRREKATSNICTAQALLAIMAGMYAVYHGPEGIKRIAENLHHKTSILAKRLKDSGFNVKHSNYFDTICVDLSENTAEIELIKQRATDMKVNLHFHDSNVLVSLDETSDGTDLGILESIFVAHTDAANIQYNGEFTDHKFSISDSLKRTSAYLEHPVFNSYHSETQMMRYLKSLENKDLSLTQSMIPLGSCTMKLNAATQLMPLSWKEFAHIHPFAPLEQATGYLEIFNELEKDLAHITGLHACSLQPNSGAQGEYAGLLVIRAYHIDHNEAHRNVCIIPASAHGTNPASAVMAGMKVVIVASDKYGNVDVDDLKAKAEENKENLAALMITYPSTHGVFEHKIKEICETIHENGGLVYMDGANMNAQVGLTNPGICGADVVHLNLHKTFAIPHGGGGPGMGPICVNEKLTPYLPGHPVVKTGGSKSIHAVSAAPWGSASILLISYAYIKMLGDKGLKRASEIAILNANYIKEKLDGPYSILFKGKENGRVAHELIVDLRPFKESAGVDAEDVAKRMIDYSFHAPTMSWPVAGTIMIEPTESEDKAELDRFINAMLSIREEISQIEKGMVDKTENVLHNAPHTSLEITADKWEHPYSREAAAFPVSSLRIQKFWPSVGRVNNSYGDRNLVCTCPPLESYMEEPVVEEGV